jgi:quercetin dioxygenase-like cupin family protein
MKTGLAHLRGIGKMCSNIPSSLAMRAARAQMAKSSSALKKGASHFVFRYFRVEPGGYSTLRDRHAHEHSVIILQGRAIIHMGENEYEPGPRDAVYISPWEEHRLEAVRDEPMGFLCVIPNKELMKKLEFE